MSRSTRSQKSTTTTSHRGRRSAARQTSPSSSATEMLPLAAVLQELGVPRSTYYGWLRRDLAPKTIKYPNGKVFVRRSDLDTWLAEQEVNA